VVAVLFFLGGIRMQLAWGESGLLAAEWLLLLVPAVLFVLLGRYDAVRTLSLDGPRAPHLLAGVLLIAGALPVVWLVGWLQSFVLPIPWELLEGLEELMTAESLGRFAWLVLILAVTPAFCEEIVFRGVLLGSTRTLDPRRMIALNSLVFGAFHLSFQTVIRFLPTAMLGALIAWAVWRTGSIWVGALMHFLNNATIVLLTSLPSVREVFNDPEAPPPLWLVPVGLLALGMGIALMQRSTERPGRGSEGGSEVAPGSVPA
jgi:sodium transport system permease protein